MMENIKGPVRISSILKKYFFNTSWLFLEKISGSILVFFVTIFLARYLSPYRFGLYNYIISVAGFLLPLATMGLDDVVIKYLVNKDGKGENVILGSALFLRMAGSLLTIIFFILAKRG